MSQNDETAPINFSLTSSLSAEDNGGLKYNKMKLFCILTFFLQGILKRDKLTNFTNNL